LGGGRNFHYGQKGETSNTAAPVFKIDEEFDDFKDVTASNEQVEKNYREVSPPMPAGHCSV
jgi:hypothetical protein